MSFCFGVSEGIFLLWSKGHIIFINFYKITTNLRLKMVVSRKLAISFPWSQMIPWSYPPAPFPTLVTFWVTEKIVKITLYSCGVPQNFSHIYRNVLYTVQYGSHKSHVLWNLKCGYWDFSRSVMSDSLRLYEPQHARPLCLLPTPRVYPDPCPLSQWCHPTISSSVVPFSSCPQSFPASGSFQMSQLFTSGGQSIEVSASTSVRN